MSCVSIFMCEYVKCQISDTGLHDVATGVKYINVFQDISQCQCHNVRIYEYVRKSEYWDIELSG